VTIGGVTVPTRLDTGASYEDDLPYLDVNRATVSALEAAGVKLAPRGSITVAGVSGPETLPLLAAADPSAPLTASFGPASIPGVVLVVHDQGTLATPEPLALAGAKLLARLGTFTLDPFAGELILRDRGFARPADSTGIANALAVDRTHAATDSER